MRPVLMSINAVDSLAGSTCGLLGNFIGDTGGAVPLPEAPCGAGATPEGATGAAPDGGRDGISGLDSEHWGPT